MKLDFGRLGAPNLQPGFAELTTALNGTNFGGVKVTLSPIAVPGTTVALTERVRLSEGVLWLTNNPPALTQAALYNDFIYPAKSTIDGNGLRIRIERLAPNTPFGLTIWSWDIRSNGRRFSDWVETGSGSTVVITNDYSFAGDIVVTHDYENSFGAVLTSSATGVLQIEGSKHPNGVTNSVPQVFVNAIRLVANPVIRITNAQLVGANIRLTIETQYPGQVVSIEEKTDLAGGAWSPVSAGGVLERHGPMSSRKSRRAALRRFTAR